MRPLQPADTTVVWEAYRRQQHGADLHDDLATDWSLPDFDRLLWRGGAAQFVELDDAAVLAGLGRLVDIDFRNRAARFEFWRLSSADPLVAARLTAASLDHAFRALGLHRVGFLLPAYLVGADYEVVSSHFEPEGTLTDYVFRRGRSWDVHAFATLGRGA